ncbi:ATP-dependent DNA helicase RecG [Weissella cibaria]|uniref:ATP-dependent DNA helicase RecG n=3 Tax=Weissella TaxID=46255 RepID=A0A1X4JKP4_9LACO|nr:ATP-dependent DNA helicase RecG [Weissella cibaria]APS27203.1 ATP-dependent DNA helicase RecG [Weissella cibaria]APU62600.1 ATP-dependent DNA helicase RecG [Weissella cibaria]APU64752.1 ATP-dependent DNA helicase RecG [Weissella cibaria]ASS51870.1 ATP-dependent DNA helicase RecG [Weissella cibaria]AVO67553.1 DNA helicase RecG [Weissella cibaria]
MASLLDLVDDLDGVGPKRVQALNKLGIYTIDDLLGYYPMRYNDLAMKTPAETQDGEKVTFKGVITSPPVVNRFGYKKTRTSFRLTVEHDTIMVSFFNQPWVGKNLELGQEVAVHGTYDKTRQGMSGIKLMSRNGDDEMEAVYPSSKEIKAKTIKDLIIQALGKYGELLRTDIVPAYLRTRYKLMNHHDTVFGMHAPTDGQVATEARRSASFEEFFVFQMRLQVIKSMDRDNRGRSINFNNDELKAFIATLPFELTDAQKRVVNEIVRDMRRPIHMNRLLQGDVGSGKTVVAALAMYAAITAGMQATLMAPTEILAQQHAKTIGNFFDPDKVRVELLTGSTKTAARRQILEDVANGEVDILIGTHALIQPDIAFRNLGLAVIDEQHRFGVQQRATLREIGMNPDILAMTATPIPRTLAITAYGEMDVSIIDQLPAGRKQIKTYWLRSNEMEKTIAFIRSQLQEGAQAYVVTPLIEESETLDVQNAEAVYAELSEYFAPTYRVGLLHGRLSNQEKEDVMAAFKANEFQVLVSTTVIEVGVDVPNSTVMLILDADRFGLSQLHQLRGRVGRGSRQSYTFLISDPKTQYGIDRMEAMVATTDGFVLAQKDLELRGAGDILGNRQSGVPEFRVGDPIADLAMMTVAQEEAIEIVSKPDWDKDPELAPLADMLSETMARYRNFD